MRRGPKTPRKSSISAADFIPEIRRRSTGSPVLMRVYAIFFVLGRVLGSRDRIRKIVFVGERFRCRFQGDREHLVDPLDCQDLEVVLDVVGHFLEVALILLGDDDSLDAAPARRQQLFFQAADR